MSDRKLTELNMDALDRVAGGFGGQNITIRNVNGTYTCVRCQETKTDMFIEYVLNRKAYYACSLCASVVMQELRGGSGGTGHGGLPM